MPPAATQSDMAAIDAALAKGEWWSRLFKELADRAKRRTKALALALAVEPPKGLWQVVDDVERLARAVRLTVVAAMRLEGFLRGLAQLRRLSPGDLAAARARAKAKAEACADARQAARDKARARREARATEIRERVLEIIEREKPASRDRDPLVEALDRRLAVDPALVDLDDLPLRETVMRICAELGITPDWSRWQAGDWATNDPPKGEAPTNAVPAPPPKRLPPPVIPGLAGLPGLTARRTDTAISLALRAGPHARPWRPPKGA